MQNQLVQIELTKDLYRPTEVEVVKDKNGDDQLVIKDRPDTLSLEGLPPNRNLSLSPDAQAILMREFEIVQAQLAEAKAKE